MKFFILLLGLLLSLPSCCGSHFRQQTPSDIRGRAAHVDELIQETVALTYFVNDDGDEVTPDTKDAELLSYCAGVWVSKTTILTAYHCIDDLRIGPLDKTLQQKQLYQLIGEPMPGSPLGANALYSVRSDISDSPMKLRLYHTAKVVAVAEDSDLALLRDESQAVPVHPFAALASGVDPGEDLDIIGMPAHSWWAYTHGYASNDLPKSHAPNGKTCEMLQVQAPIWYGNSGGPAFNAAGQIVGISSMFSQKVPDRAFFVHLNVIDKFLQTNEDAR